MNLKLKKDLAFKFVLAVLTSFLMVKSSQAQGDNCGNAIDLCSITSPYSSTTVGHTNDFSYCSMVSSVDMIFYIDIPDGVTLTIGQTINGYDSRHTLRYGGSCPGNTEIKCTDDPDLETITWTNATGSLQRVYWIQAGYSSGAGSFTLAWSAPGACSTTCDDPSNLNATSITAESADLLWIENGISNTWNIEYGLSGFSPTGSPTITSVNDNPHSLYGLSSSTSYEYYIQSDCGTLTSNWVGPYTFSTIGCNLQNPSGLIANNVTSSTVDLSWTENGNSTSWDVSIGAPGYTPTVATLSNSNSSAITYTGLSLSTTYDIYVRSNCGGSSTSWIGPVTITTLDIPTNYTSEMIDGWAKGVIQADDNNYIFTGYANNDIQLVKTQQGGDLIWEKTFGGTSTDYGYALVNSGDGNFINLGKTNSSGLNTNGNYDILISKIDYDGNPIWSRSIGTSSSDISDQGTIIRNADNTFSFVCSGTYLADMIFGHIAADGTTLGLREVSLRTGAKGYGLTQTQDGGWAICGNYTFNGTSEFFVVKISATYTLQWSMVWGDAASNQDNLYTIIENGANDYTVFGATYGLGTSPQNMYATRFTNNGSGPTVIWQKAYGDANSCYFTHAITASDGNYVVTGTSGAYDYVTEYQDSYLAKINPANGSIIWQTFKSDDGASNRIGECVIEDNQGNFVVAGLGGYDMLKFDAFGFICDGGLGSLVEENLGLSFSNLLNNSEATSYSWFGANNYAVSPTFASAGIFVPGCNVTPIVLSNSTFNFKQECADHGGSHLAWLHNYEKEDAFFILEGSSDGIHFNSIEQIAIIPSSVTLNYNYWLEHTPNYIRLVKISNSSKSTFIKTLVNNCEETNFSVYPNPSLSDFIFKSPRQHEEYIGVVFDVQGKTIDEFTIPSNTEYFEIDAQNWNSGVYIFIVYTVSKATPTFQTKLVKTH